MHADAAVRDADVLAGGRLLVVGGYVRADGTASWLPASASGWQPSNCYLLLEGDRAALVDTGLAAHAGIVVEQLRRHVPDGVPLSVFLTRAELDCIGNLGPIASSLPLEGVFTGGNNNPFDAFDAVPDVRGAVHLHVGRTQGEVPIVLSESRSLEVIDAPLRLLATYWAYDGATRTLFTSDSFGHQLVESPDRPRTVTAADGVDPDTVLEYALAKFGWIERATTTAVAGGIEAVFAEREIEIVAPTNGCAIVGADAVRAHYDALQAALARCSRPRSASAGVAVTIAGEAAERPAAQAVHGLPRRLTPSITWLGDCLKRLEAGKPVHVHTSSFLVVGEAETLLVDTGHPTHWSEMQRQLDELLEGRDLDWIFPTHPELPHAGNLNRLLARYPRAAVTGDTRDYALYCPEFVDRLVPRIAGEEVDLGGRRIVFLDAPIKDLPSTQWAYETSEQVLFVADAFGYTHGGIPGAGAGEPMHLPGECGLLSTELAAEPSVDQTAFLTRAALFWSRYVDVAPHFAEVEALLERYPARLIAPAHGNVIADFDALLPVLRAAHRAVYVA
jgi:flavorubredoxin